MENLIQPGDIILTYGNSFISKAIRFFSRTIGEKRTKVNHVGLTVVEGSLESCIIVEALSKVVKHLLWYGYGPKSEDKVAIYRPLNINKSDIDKIVTYANLQVNKKYGYFKIATHLLDWLLFGAYFFRRLTNNKNYPICSWLVAYSYSEVGKHFNVDPGAAQPDDIWDFIIENPDKYELVHELKRIW